MSQTPRSGGQDDDELERRKLISLDTNAPQSARIWNYWLGGKDNYAIDREVGDQIAEIHPGIVPMAREGRKFLQRAVEFVTREHGIRQFLDIGTGLPTMNNTHQVAQAIAPDARIVYVDNDPLVLNHARALLIGTDEGETNYIDADIRDPGRILDQARTTLDFDRPIALMLVSILGHFADDEEVYGIVGELVNALAPGSWLILSQDTADFHGDSVRNAMRTFMDAGGPTVVPRDYDQMSRFFEGLDLAEPGLVSPSAWRNQSVDGDPVIVAQYAGVARKP